MSVDASELRKLAADLRREASLVKPRVSAAVRKTLFDIEADAKTLAPVDTGNLQNSISTTVDGDGLGGEVGPTAEYGIWVEAGTSTQAGQPFLGPAFDRRVDSFFDSLGQIVRL